MPKRILARALIEKAGYSKYRAEKLVDAVIGLVKRGLGEGKSVELGRLGELQAVTRKTARRITRNLKHVGPTVVTVNKQRKTIKLRSKLDLGTEEEKISNKAAISTRPIRAEEDQKTRVAQLHRPATVALVNWRGRAHRVPSRFKPFKTNERKT